MSPETQDDNGFGSPGDERFDMRRIGSECVAIDIGDAQSYLTLNQCGNCVPERVCRNDDFVPLPNPQKLRCNPKRRRS
jgi:hypothetical protein